MVGAGVAAAGGGRVGDGGDVEIASGDVAVADGGDEGVADQDVVDEFGSAAR